MYAGEGSPGSGVAHVVSCGGFGDIEAENSDVVKDGPCPFGDSFADGILDEFGVFEALDMSGAGWVWAGGVRFCGDGGDFGDVGSVLFVPGESAAFDFDEVFESGGVEAAEPAAEGACGVVLKGGESLAEFAPEELDEFLCVGGITQLGASPCFEEGVVVGEEAMPCGVVAPGVESLEEGGSREGAAVEGMLFLGGHYRGLLVTGSDYRPMLWAVGFRVLAALRSKLDSPTRSVSACRNSGPMLTRQSVPVVRTYRSLGFVSLLELLGSIQESMRRMTSVLPGKRVTRLWTRWTSAVVWSALSKRMAIWVVNSRSA